MDVSGSIMFITSQNQSGAQQKCCSRQTASQDHSCHLLAVGRGDRLLLWSLTSPASLRILPLNSFVFLILLPTPRGTLWPSAALVRDQCRRGQKVTYHVRANDCKMQKMSASPLLCHWKKNNVVPWTWWQCKPKRLRKIKIHTYPKGRTQSEHKTQLDREKTHWINTMTIWGKQC